MSTAFEFYVPGFFLMQQAIENLIKACLKNDNIKWPTKGKGHDFLVLLDLGKNNNSIKQILQRNDILTLLKELQEGYTSHRYGESGVLISDFHKMIDLFDEVVFMLKIGFIESLKSKQSPKDIIRLDIYSVPKEIEQIFIKNLKQPYNYEYTLPL
jgi:hypothetical protein